MRLWLIFVQHDGHTWLEAAWDDESTAENNPGWQEEVDRVEKICQQPGYEMRIASTAVDGVFELFDVPNLRSEKATEAS